MHCHHHHLGDEPAHEHKKYFGSQCKFIRGESTANVVDIKIYPAAAAAAATAAVESVEVKVLRCKICLDEDINIQCPICRQSIKECLRVYQP